MTILTNVSVPAHVSEVGGVNRRSPTGKLRRCAAAPCTCRDRVVRDVSCVTCRACDVARDRSIGRESGEGSVSGGRGDLAKIPPSSPSVPLSFT